MPAARSLSSYLIFALLDVK